MVNSTLDMYGFIDDDCESVPATRYPTIGQWIDGRWISEDASPDNSHLVTLQAASEKEIQTLQAGGERVTDVRKIYINDGDLFSIKPSDFWEFEGVDGRFKTIRMDNRPWRNYCKIIISLVDPNDPQ